jgi:hypothetical protein
MKKTLATKKIIYFLKKITNSEHDSDLAKVLNVDKQSIYQYKQKTNEDIQQKIITLLLSEMDV